MIAKLVKKAISIARKYKTECEFKFCDITSESQILDVKNYLINQFGQIDILINNAAIDPKVESNSDKNLSRLEEFSINQWNLELAVGLTGAMLIKQDNWCRDC